MSKQDDKKKNTNKPDACATPPILPGDRRRQPEPKPKPETPPSPRPSK